MGRFMERPVGADVPSGPGDVTEGGPLIRSSSQAPHHSFPPGRRKFIRSAARPLPNVTAGAGSRWGPRMATFPPGWGRLWGCVLQASPLRGEAVERSETDEGALFSGTMWPPGDISLCGAGRFYGAICGKARRGRCPQRPGECYRGRPPHPALRATFPPVGGRLWGCVLQSSPLRGEAVERRETDEGALFSGPMWPPGGISISLSP